MELVKGLDFNKNSKRKELEDELLSSADRL